MKVKKILLTLGISLLALVGYTNAENSYWLGIGVYNTEYTNPRASNLNLYIPTNYKFYTTIGETKYNNVYAIYDKIFFYRDLNNELAVYNGIVSWNSATKGGGKLNNYYICDYISEDLNKFTNCIGYEYDKEAINTYLEATKDTDKIFYGDGLGRYNNVNLERRSIPFLAFSIEETQKTILFYTNIGYFRNACEYFEQFGLPCQNGTLNYNIEYTGNYDITTFPSRKVGNSPIGKTNTINKICQPIKLQIDLYGRNYNTGLCYSNEQIITGGQVINETPISIFEAFSTYQDYRNGYNLIGNYCHTEQGNTYEECQTALQSIGKKPGQILFKTIQAELPTNKVYQYCHLQLDFTEEEKRNIGRCQLTDEEKYATGVNQETSNPNVLEGYEDMLLQSNSDILIPGEGTVFDEILPDGVITRKNLVTNFDFIGDLMSLMTKISAIFIIRPNVEGIIPPVILSLLLLIILFKIFKK